MLLRNRHDDLLRRQPFNPKDLRRLDLIPLKLGVASLPIPPAK
jgi:hypothetical protein